MKPSAISLVIAGIFAVTTALAHEGQSEVKGKGIVNAIDAPNHKVNLSHEAIAALGWPAMKMDFAVASEVDLKALQPGAAVVFTIEKSKSGAFEIHSIKLAK